MAPETKKLMIGDKWGLGYHSGYQCERGCAQAPGRAVYHIRCQHSAFSSTTHLPDALILSQHAWPKAATRQLDLTEMLNLKQKIIKKSGIDYVNFSVTR